MGQKEGELYSCSGLVIITSACLWSIHSLCALVSAVTGFYPKLEKYNSHVLCKVFGSDSCYRE